jgi:hypothetical protein
MSCARKNDCDYVMPLDFKVSKLSDTAYFLSQGDYIDWSKVDKKTWMDEFNGLPPEMIFKDSCSAKTYFIKHDLPLIKEFIK